MIHRSQGIHSHDLAEISAHQIERGLEPTTFQPATIRSYPGVMTFASGSNSLGDMTGFAELGLHVGVVAGMSQRSLSGLLRLGHERPDLQIFVDSGAFSEVSFETGRPTYPKPLTDSDWRLILSQYLKLGRAFGSRMLFVAPDRVADQSETLARLELYAEDITKVVETGAKPIVALQGGALSESDFLAKTQEILDFSVVAGIPSKKAATSLQKIEELLQSDLPGVSGFHFLGLGPNNPRLSKIIDMVQRYKPGLAISIDAVVKRAHVGWQAGRPITLAKAAIDAQYDPFISGSLSGDYTDEIAEFEADLGREKRYRLALAAGHSKQYAREYARDYENVNDPSIDFELDAAYRAHMLKLTSVNRSADSIKHGLRVQHMNVYDYEAQSLIDAESGPSRRRNPTHQKIVSLSRIPAKIRNSAAFRKAVEATKRRYGTPTGAILVKIPKGSSKVLAPIGELGTYHYYAEDTLWYHDPGDYGDEYEEGDPQILAWDAVQKMPVITFPNGSGMDFTERGIQG